PADAVLGADTAAVARDQVVHRPVDRRRQAQERLIVLVGGAADVEVQIAVAQVTIGNDAPPWRTLVYQPRRLDDEARQLAGRDRNVVLDAGADTALGFGNGLAQPPEHLPLRFV